LEAGRIDIFARVSGSNLPVESPDISLSVTSYAANGGDRGKRGEWGVGTGKKARRLRYETIASVDVESGEEMGEAERSTGRPEGEDKVERQKKRRWRTKGI